MTDKSEILSKFEGEKILRIISVEEDDTSEIRIVTKSGLILLLWSNRDNYYVNVNEE